jgi:multiple sugar transport system substrate-binding protein
VQQTAKRRKTARRAGFGFSARPAAVHPARIRAASGAAGEEQGMSKGHLTRRRLAGGAALAAGYLGGRAPAYAQNRQPFAGVSLNVSCWASPYARFVGEYLPEFIERTGIRVAYDTPGFPIYNQRADLELSTRGSAFDVLNITFIYTSRWIGAGWFTPIDEFINDRNKTPAEWDFADFLPGTVQPMRDRQGRNFGVPWVADVLVGGAGRFDLLRQAGFGMPNDFGELERAMAAVHNKDEIPAYIVENHYGWTYIPFLQGFGGNVFRNPPEDLMPTLDTPEAIEAAEFLGKLLRQYGPPQALGYNVDQTTQAFRQGRVNYQNNNHAFLLPAAEPGSRIRETCNFSLFPAGPKGRFPGIASHAWGIPIGSRNKDAAWEFIKWSMSKEFIQRLVNDKGYGAVTRKSILDGPGFRERTTVNGFDMTKLYTDTLDLAAQGHMRYRTVHVYPQANAQITQALERVVSGQMGARESLQQAQRNAIADLRRAGVRP